MFLNNPNIRAYWHVTCATSGCEAVTKRKESNEDRYIIVANPQKLVTVLFGCTSV
jgi:hypothetical protein